MYASTLSLFQSTVFALLANRNKDSTVGQSFIGIKNRILSPDPTSGEGEVIVSSRAVFMGYVKVYNMF